MKQTSRLIDRIQESLLTWALTACRCMLAMHLLNEKSAPSACSARDSCWLLMARPCGCWLGCCCMEASISAGAGVPGVSMKCKCDLPSHLDDAVSTVTQKGGNSQTASNSNVANMMCQTCTAMFQSRLETGLCTKITLNVLKPSTGESLCPAFFLLLVCTDKAHTRHNSSWCPHRSLPEVAHWMCRARSINMMVCMY